MSKPKVYYNSACPVCHAGIRYQQRKLGERVDEIEWIDVHECNEAAAEAGATLELVRERLHAVDAEGRAHVGVDAFAEIWAHTPGQTLLSRIVRWPVLRWPAQWLYNGFAKALYRWNRRRGRW